MNDGMSEAIAAHGSKNLSKRAKRDHSQRLLVACFGTEKVTREMITGVAPEMTAKESADNLREIALCANKSQAKKLLKRADEIERGGKWE